MKNDLRTHRVTVRLSSEEMNELLKLSHITRRPVSQLLRENIIPQRQERRLL